MGNIIITALAVACFSVATAATIVAVYVGGVELARIGFALASCGFALVGDEKVALVLWLAYATLVLVEWRNEE